MALEGGAGDGEVDDGDSGADVVGEFDGGVAGCEDAVEWGGGFGQWLGAIKIFH